MHLLAARGGPCDTHSLAYQASSTLHANDLCKYYTRPSDSAIKPPYTAGWNRSRIGRRLAPIKAINRLDSISFARSPTVEFPGGWVHRLERLRVLLAAFSAQTERRSLRPRSSSSQVRPLFEGFEKKKKRKGRKKTPRRFICFQGGEGASLKLSRLVISSEYLSISWSGSLSVWANANRTFEAR